MVVQIYHMMTCFYLIQLMSSIAYNTKIMAQSISS